MDKQFRNEKKKKNKHEQIYLMETEIDTDYVICVQRASNTWFPRREREKNIGFGWLNSLKWAISQRKKQSEHICIRHNTTVLASIEHEMYNFFQ